MALLKLFKKTPTSDEELIARYKATKESQWVGLLYQRYTHLCLGVCMKYLRNEEDAKDAVMQVFEKLMDDLLRHEIQFFQGWLHTYLRNHCLMALRKKRPASTYRDDLANDGPGGVELDNGENLSDKELLEMDIERLEKAIDALKSDQKDCIRMFYLDNKSYKEIEEMTGMDFKQVKSHIQNGKRNLKMYMERHG
ncbi:MAG: sigma-70 family RNA polymerase sigma factor [Bacteroidetes bacterium]|jgi:RNA polymerase sigma-70 factor (ECF subfamily)|nr:sigma-70 family RNA polymerase sigma factor [Bacteroidota bacterium]